MAEGALVVDWFCFLVRVTGKKAKYLKHECMSQG